MNMISGQIMGIFKVEPGGCAGGVDIKFEKKRGSKDDSKVFGLFTRTMDIPLVRWGGGKLQTASLINITHLSVPEKHCNECCWKPAMYPNC